MLDEFLSGYGDYASHPCPNCDTTLDAASHFDAPNTIPSISTFLQHTPLLVAFFAGIVKMIAKPVALLALILGAYKDLMRPSASTSRPALTVLLLIALGLVVTDDHYQMEYPAFTLTGCAGFVALSESLHFFAPRPASSFFGLLGALPKAYVFYLLMNPSIQAIPHADPLSLYDYNSYGPSNPCRNGHTSAGIYNGSTRFASLVGAGSASPHLHKI